MLLLFLGTAEQEIEQIFGRRRARRKRNGAGEGSGGNEHHAAPHGLIRQRCTQPQLHPTPEIPPRQAVPPARFTLVRDGKRGMSRRRMAEKKMPRIVQSDVPRMLRSALAVRC